LLFLHAADPPTTDRSTLSLHDALPIWRAIRMTGQSVTWRCLTPHSGYTLSRAVLPLCICALSIPIPSACPSASGARTVTLKRCRSEEHTSELQSRFDLVCRLLLETKTT